MTNETVYWDNDAKKYDNRAKKSYKAYQKMINLIKKEITDEMTVLDIGTGTGEIPVNIYKNAKSIEATDVSPEMIKIAQNKSEARGIQNIKFLVQDSNNLSYKDNSFDVIIIINLLHFIPNPENVLNEAKRLLKKDGKIIIASFLHNENIKSRIISYIMKRKGHPVVTKFDSNTICEFIIKCSLKIISQKNIKNIMPIIYMISSK
jgi:ubiquinone/menaquinone biosynthesis C-methylase UbiE